MTSTTFVLVHGAWGGGWHWRRVADRLRSRGHSVFTPTLSGLGERVHQLHPGVDLSLHIADVLGVIKYESLENIVLVGHSYSGFVISGVAEIIPGKIRSIVFLDAFVPRNGEALVDSIQVQSGRNHLQPKVLLQAKTIVLDFSLRSRPGKLDLGGKADISRGQSRWSRRCAVV